MRGILIEFNELSPVLMDKFIAAGKLPNFKGLRDQSAVYLTEAKEEQENLEPWIQWVTVHSGLPYEEHGIQNLGDGYRMTEKNVWDVLSEHGKRVWVCGSMNINYATPINGWVLPDPWARNVEPYPENEFRPYHRFISANVQEYTREDVPLSRSDQVDFLKFMVRHGLAPGTVAAIATQLARERRGDEHWKRAVILDRLQFDVFRSYWKRERPDFATFFLNSTAHFQHLYWRNMEPEHFKVKPEAGEQAVYQDAILYGYEQMDAIIGKLMHVAGDDTALIFATALSQQPCLTYEDEGGKTLYRPLDFQSFMKTVGITQPADAAPVMAEEFHLDFGDERAAQEAERILGGLTFENESAIRVKREGSSLLCGCQVWRQVDADASLQTPDGRSVPFFDLFYQIDLIKSGMHHRDGMLWIRRPGQTPSVNAEKVSLTAIAPTILDMYGVEAPAAMSGEVLVGSPQPVAA